MPRRGFESRIGDEATELATAIALVGAGVGATLVPASVQDLRRTGVDYRPILASAPPRTPFLALHRPGPDVLPVVGSLLAVAREVLGRPRASGPGAAARPM